jgi:hypothetical protein
LTINRGCFDWVLGFGTTQLNAQRLDFWLPSFAELSFLREADKHGNLPALLSSIRHSEPVDRFLNAVQRTLGVRELLTYTSVIAIRKQNSALIEEEMVYSSQFSYWGMPLPECPNCGNHNVQAIPGQEHKKIKNLVIVRCHGCKASTKGIGIGRPVGVREVAKSTTGRVKYYWKPLRLESPWVGHRWRYKGSAALDIAT